MSYLHVPRVHFLGLFYTDPANLNNLVENYDLKNPLDYYTGTYMYPDGTAQLWLEQCVVTSVVDAAGTLVTDAASDALVGAAVTSPSPETPKPVRDGKGYYTPAKIVDLDPNMQIRSEIYGLRIYVDIPGGGGFSGLLAVPQLRDLFFQRNNGGLKGSQTAVGTWHQRLGDIVWTDPAKRSPVYDALRAGGDRGLDVKMAVDLYQTDRGKQFTQGDRFGYGRLVGAIGIPGADDPQQLVPGRRLYDVGAFSSTAKVTDTVSYTRQAGEAADAQAALVAQDGKPPPWNRTDFVVYKQGDRSYLAIDLFNSMPLQEDKTGKLAPGGVVIIGLMDPGKGFTALTNGTVSLDEYIQLTPELRALKDIYWPAHAAIFTIELVDDEPAKIATTPVAIAISGQTVVVRENPNGVYLNIERASTRMEPSSAESFDVYGYTFGMPMTAPPSGLTLTPQRYDDASKKSKDEPIFSAELDGAPRGPGRFSLAVKTGGPVPLTDLRKPLDSALCFLKATGEGYLVGEPCTPCGPTPAPLLSLLFWMNLRVVPNPTWDDNIKSIMQSYARLYPGMVSRLDIGNLDSIRANAQAIIERYQLARTDPSFMPVVRDMSPSTVAMMLQFLAGLNP